MKSTFILNRKYAPDLEAIAKEIATNTSNSRTINQLTEEACDAIIEKIIEKNNCTAEQAFIAITTILQQGGTNKGAGNNSKYSSNAITLTAQDLQNIINTVAKNATNRQFARTMADDIAQIALHAGIEGDLANQMRFEYPDLTSTEAVWCSNFQTTNQNCPDRVREWLVYNYKNRFRK